MNKRQRRSHTAEQKAELLRQHVVDKKPVSVICNEAQVQPSLFYTWQRELLAGAPLLFENRRTPSREKELDDWGDPFNRRSGGQQFSTGDSLEGGLSRLGGCPRACGGTGGSARDRCRAMRSW